MTLETRKRPRASGAFYKKQVGETASPATVDDTADQMRRRRDASWRLPPVIEHGAERDVRRRELACRDPWLTTPRRPLSRESALAAWDHLAGLGLGSDVVAAALGLGEVA